jgi:hypothetical protein
MLPSKTAARAIPENSHPGARLRWHATFAAPSLSPVNKIKEPEQTYLDDTHEIDCELSRWRLPLEALRHRGGFLERGVATIRLKVSYDL